MPTDRMEPAGQTPRENVGTIRPPAACQAYCCVSVSVAEAGFGLASGFFWLTTSQLEFSLSTNPENDADEMGVMPLISSIFTVIRNVSPAGRETGATHRFCPCAVPPVNADRVNGVSSTTPAFVFVNTALLGLSCGMVSK